MTFKIPNTLAAGAVDQAGPDSVDFDIIVAAIQGTGTRSGLAVTQNGAGAKSVVVAAGIASVNNAYTAVSGATVTVPNNATGNPRLDLVVVDGTGTPSVVAGAPGAAGTSALFYPQVPANSAVIAGLYVAAGFTQVLTANITDKRIVCGEPMANMLSATRRSPPTSSPGSRAFPH